MNPDHMDEKKALKKRRKFTSRMKESKGIICTDTPCANIVLCNEGQATGLTKEQINNVITSVLPQVPLPKYIAEKGESYSFLTFNNMENARRFYEECNGVMKIDKQGPIYMIYVENVPSLEIICQATNPEGLHLIDNFITKEEEYHFIKVFDWSKETDSNNLKNRQVKHYGYEFRYGSNDVDLTEPLIEKIPQECDVLWRRLKDAGIEIEKAPDQLTVNKYQPGQGIPSHVDKHSPFGDTILSLSLGSSVVMDWRHHSGKYVPVVLTERSMLVMRGEARYDWQHGIQSRTWDPLIKTRPNPTDNNNQNPVKVITTDTVARSTRISLTFRWTRSGPCECVYKTLCDSVSYSADIEDDLASNLEDLHVHQVYEQIAGHFSTTRHKPWPKVVQFMARVPAGALVLDLGCGNGKNMLRRDDIFQLGCERSSELLAAAAATATTTTATTADHVRLHLLAAPLRDGCADYILCIAVIHHFCSKVRRLQAISTIGRLLRRGGQALVTVWAKDQTRSKYLAQAKQTLDPKPNEEVHTIGGLNLPVHENRTQFQHNDLLVPWKLRNVKDNKLSSQPETTLLRYYHVFEENELAELCREAGGLDVESSFYEEGNWCVVCRKI